jgi:DNA-binding transcriptional LysR family regulator
MTLEQLRIFIAVAEKQHVTQAANELHLTQSATSAAIAALEARYGIKLFDRVGRGIALTQTGRDFLNEARAVVARAKAAAQVLNDLAGLKRGSLSLAASQTVANYWLPPRIETFRKAYPGIDLRIAIANTEQVAHAVHQGDADLGFVEGEVDDPALAIRKIEGDSLAIVVGVNHPWTGQSRITPKLLTKTCWILREPGSGTRSMFEAALKKFAASMPSTIPGAKAPRALADAMPDPSVARAREIAAADGRRAVEIVRERAAEWGVKPDRIGMIGFSAGAFLTTDVALEPRAAPLAFVAPIYGGETQGRAVPADAPPLFTAVAQDDRMFFRVVEGLYADWSSADRPAELHIFTRGGHGFGVGKRGLPVDRWIDLLGDWLADQEGGA